MTSFDNLPDEIILKILSLFSQKELQSTVKCVSSRWNRLAEDSSLYREIIVDEEFLITEVTYLLWRYADDIKCLQFLHIRYLNELAEYVSRCSNLQSLMIEWSSGGSDQIVEAMKNCQNLKTIVMKDSFGVRNLHGLFQAIGKRSMKKINIRSSVDYVSAEDLSHVRNVEDLRLKDVKVDIFGIYKFCQNNFENLTTLKVITFPGNIERFSLDVNETICAAIGDCKNLKTLCLGYQIMVNMNDSGLQKLSHLSNLSTLVIHYANKVTAEGFANFFKQPVAKNLRKVRFYKCSEIDNVVVRNIARNCFHLEKFMYEQAKEDENNIDPFDITMLVRNCNKLKWLHLFAIDIEVAEVLHLLPTYLPHLESLRYCNYDDPMKIPSFVHRLECKMPDFNVDGVQSGFSLYVDCRRKERN